MLDTLSNILTLLFQVFREFPRSRRIDHANQEWIEDLVFITTMKIKTSLTDLKHMQSGIAETHNVYTWEMLTAEAAMRAGKNRVVHDSNYSNLLRRDFFLNYSQYYELAKSCNPIENKNPIFVNRRANFLCTLIISAAFFGLYKLLSYFKVDASIFDYLLIVCAFIIYAFGTSFILEIFFTESVDYHKIFAEDNPNLK